MRRSVVKAKWSRGEPVLVMSLHFTDASVFELASLMGVDAIWMDMEHHGYSLETASNLIRATRVGQTDILIRPAKGEFMRMGRMLEMGAQGLMVPRCDSAEEAAEVVKWAKFHPQGKRGYDGGNPDNPYLSLPMDQYVKQANAETFLVIQLEEQHAIDQAEEVAAVEGVDALMLGPGDFTITSGIAGQFDHPLVHQAMDRIAKAAAKHGKEWGRPAGSLEAAKEYMDMGARLICHGCDLPMVKFGIEQIQKDFGKLGFTFNNQLGGGA